MLIDQNGNYRHTIITNAYSDSGSTTWDNPTTGDGIRLHDTYTLEYVLYRNDGSPHQKTCRLSKTGIELMQGLSAAIDFNKLIQRSNLGETLFWTRHLCKEALILYATFKICGTGSKVQREMKREYHRSMIEMVLKALKGKRGDREVLQSLLSGYMWFKFQGENYENSNVTISDLPSFEPGFADRMIASGG